MILNYFIRLYGLQIHWFCKPKSPARENSAVNWQLPALSSMIPPEWTIPFSMDPSISDSDQNKAAFPYSAYFF